jgi:hypothetical protein
LTSVFMPRRRHYLLKKSQPLNVCHKQLRCLTSTNHFLTPRQSGRLQGSVLVSRRAGLFLKGMPLLCIYRPTYRLKRMEEKLQGCRFSEPEDIQHITACFDKSTKLSFRRIDEPSYVKFGTARDLDVNFNIRFGQLKLAGWVTSLNMPFLLLTSVLGRKLQRSLNPLYKP